MVILGAGGHAKEVYDVLTLNGYSNIAFFDDITDDNKLDRFFIGKKLLRSEEELKACFREENSDFVLGVGGIKARHFLWQKALNSGGKPAPLIANNSYVSDHSLLSLGVNVMAFAFVSHSVSIGKSTLINTRANIHHDVTIGDFSEIAPGAILLGKSAIGSYSFIGAGAIILPGISVGNNCTVGAGAVVTKNIDDNTIVKGNPAK